jgi:hypothetical protein
MDARSSQRVRAAPARLDEEQAADADMAALLAQFRNPMRDESSDGESSDDSNIEFEGDDGDEHKEAAAPRAAVPWQAERQPVQRKAFVPARRHPLSLLAYTSALDFFSLLLPESFIDSMVTETNKYGLAKYAAPDAAAAAPAAALRWQDTTAQEIKALLGCIIFMGIVCMTDTRSYWAETTRQRFVTDTFSRDRFLQLLRCLRFGEGAEGDAAVEDKLAKLRPFINDIGQRFRRVFSPGCALTPDEAMISFSGRHGMVQYIARKASPTGFKVWMLVDCETNYVWSFEIYQGKQEKKREEGAAAAVVKSLITHLQPHSYHVLGMDNFFTSVKLLRDLHQYGFYAVGTARATRKEFPRELVKEIEDKPRGTHVFRQRGDLVCTAWMDKKPVYFVSTCCDPARSETVQRWSGGERVDVACPEVVPTYLKYMRGVDVFSQRLSYSKIGRRSMKWFYSIAWFLVDTAIHNAFVLYQRRHNKTNFGEKDFRMELMQQLVGSFSARVAHARFRKHPRDSLHRLEHTEQRSACVQCSKRVGKGQHNQRTNWRCLDCEAFLCVPDCYNKHVQQLTAHAADIDHE